MISSLYYSSRDSSYITKIGEIVELIPSNGNDYPPSPYLMSSLNTDYYVLLQSSMKNLCLRGKNEYARNAVVKTSSSN